MEVMIERSANSCPQVPVDVKIISSIHWDNISGGVNARQSGYSLYGYINYKLATKLGLTSGQHESYGNDAKVMIPKSLNDNSPYNEGYKYLLKRAGKKPSSHRNRLTGKTPCTERILQLLEDGDKTREEIRSVLLQENYTAERIRGALNRMNKDGRIHYECGGNPQKQIIHRMK